MVDYAPQTVTPMINQQVKGVISAIPHRGIEGSELGAAGTRTLSLSVSPGRTRDIHAARH